MTDVQSSIEARFAGNVGNFALDVDFRAPLQGITALFGPSGCGKTTILRCMAGLTRLSGRLKVGGETWQDESGSVFRKPHHRPIGYVFQEASLFPHMSVRKNLMFGASRTTGPSNGGLLGFDNVVDLLGIDRLLDRDPGGLSGGERQKIAVGRALLSQPRLLLMDEPLSGLDRMAKDDILPSLEALHETLSIPILYVSHDIGEVARLADRMVVIASGKRVADGPMSDMLERLDIGPATGRFEAGVILTARVAAHDTAYQLTQLDHGGQQITIPIAEVGIGEEVRLRIRARDVALTKHMPEGISIRNILSGTIAEIAEEPETAFAETLVDIGGGKLRARITRASLAELGLEPGMPIFALIKSVSFDGRSIGRAQTGTRDSESNTPM